jgi:chromosome segregation ATPase
MAGHSEFVKLQARVQELEAERDQSLSDAERLRKQRDDALLREADLLERASKWENDAERLQRTLEDEDSRWANIYAQKCTENERLWGVAQRNADWCDDLKTDAERLWGALDNLTEELASMPHLSDRVQRAFEKACAALDREGEDG